MMPWVMAVVMAATHTRKRKKKNVQQTSIRQKKPFIVFQRCALTDMCSFALLSVRDSAVSPAARVGLCGTRGLMADMALSGNGAMPAQELTGWSEVCFAVNAVTEPRCPLKKGCSLRGRCIRKKKKKNDPGCVNVAC